MPDLDLDADIVVPDKPPAAWQSMSWEMAMQLKRRGIQFAPHFVSHNVFSKLDNTSMQQEIFDYWRTLGKELLDPLKVSYPTGREFGYGTL